MTSRWKEFTQQAPELAAIEARFRSGVAYAGPRVHPVTSIIGEQLFLFMEPTSFDREFIDALVKLRED